MERDNYRALKDYITDEVVDFDTGGVTCRIYSMLRYYRFVW